MTQFDRITLGRQARELGFVRDTFEKVCRLADVLAFLESDALLSKTLALKGGTAINLTIFDLPRLSVDIDLDYSENVPREEMLAQREIITERIRKYMAAAGYRPSLKLLLPEEYIKMFLSHLREDRITRGKAQCLLAVGVPLDMRQLAYPSRGYYSRYSLRLACHMLPIYT